MDDKELLEMAALAYNANNPSWFEYPFEAFRKGFLSKWNPLENDGDAFRLSVLLKLRIDQSYVYEMKVMVGNGDTWVIEKYNGEQLTATRRAIVRAAAEIGRNMK